MLFIKNLKAKFVTLTLTLVFASLAIAVPPIYATAGEASGQVADICDSSGGPAGCTPASQTQQDACAGLNELNNSTATNCSNLGTQGQGFSNTIATVVTILSWVVGIVSIIMILVGGLKYITSGGDSNKVGAAKGTIIYALIGLAIAGLAQVLVHFVLSTAANAKIP